MNKFEALIKKKIFLSILLLSFLEPFGIGEMTIYLGGVWKYIHYIFLLIKVLFYSYVLILILAEMKHYSTVLIYIIIFEVFECLISVIRNNYSLDELKVVIHVIGIALLVDVCIRKADPYTLFDIISKIMGFFIILNFISIVLYPKGIYIDNRRWGYNYILAYKNRHIYYYLPYIFCEGLKDHIKKGNYRPSFWIMNIIILASCILGKSSTSTVCICACILFLILFSKINVPHVINLYTIYATSFFISLMIVFFEIQYRYSDFIKKVFNKDATFSHRTVIWNRAINEIIKHPIIGNGLGSFTDLFKNWDVSSMHNKFTDVIYVGGVVLFIAFTLIFFSVGINLNKAYGNKLYGLSIAILLSYFILFLTEGRRNISHMCICLMIMYNLPFIIEKYKLFDNRKRFKIVFGHNIWSQ